MTVIAEFVEAVGAVGTGRSQAEPSPAMRFVLRRRQHSDLNDAAYTLADCLKKWDHFTSPRVDFAVNVMPFRRGARRTWHSATVSRTLLFFYGALSQLY